MKNIKNIFSKALFLGALIVLVSISCERDLSDDAVLAEFPKNGDVYIDGFSSGLEYFPFGDSYFEAFTVDNDTKYSGSSAMRFDVPNVGDPNGAYAGAIFPDNGGRNLTDFDALTFWAKATKAASINEIGFGQDFGENKYQVVLNGLSLTTNWRMYTIAMPDPSVLTQEKGLFWYAEGPEDGAGYTFWIDELQFVTLGTIGQPRASIYGGSDITAQTFVGVQNSVTELQFTANLESGENQTIFIAPGYYSFSSSDTSVVKVNDAGIVFPIGPGSAVVTAELNGTKAAGSCTYNVLGSFKTAPVPTQDASDVISIFSNAYVNQPVDYYNGYWAPFQTTQGQDDLSVNGDDVIYYTDLNFVGIQFATDAPTINASAMTHFRVDIQVQDTIQSGDFITVRVVDAGADNTVGSSDDSSGEIMLTSTLVQGDWLSVDVSFSELGLSNRSNLAQIVFVSDATVEQVYVDNIYFYKGSGGGPTGPTVAAPAPTRDAANVLSVFSDEYTDIPNTDFTPDWGQATVVTQEDVAGNNTLVYKGLNYQGVVFEASQDVSAMTHIHMDVWTTNSSMLNSFLISNGGVEASNAVTVPTSGWVGFDFALSSFSSVDLADVIQMKFDGNGDIYLDNIYFYTESTGGNEPTTAAPMPTRDANDVISVYSDVYTNIAGTNFNPDWGQATVYSEVMVGGDNTILLSGLNYQGFELSGSQDVSSMTHLHMDYWTKNSTALQAFLISSAPTEVGTNLAVPTADWGSVDIPLSSFSPVDLADLIQFKFDGDGDIYFDNIYFYTDGPAPTEPTTAAPAPTRPSADVVSIFSDAYTNLAGTNLNPDWGQATVTTEIDVAGDNTLKLAGLNYQGIQLDGGQDMSSLSHLHLDIWTANSSALNVFLISSGPVETPFAVSVPTSGWLQLDIPLTSFSPVDLADIIQFKFDGDGDIFIDNIYFYSMSTGGEPMLPLDFEDGVNPVIAFDGGATATVAANPDMNGNASAQVLQFNKVVGSAWYSGVVFDDELRPSSPLIDLANGTVFSVKIWSPNAGINVRFQLEGGANPAYEVFQTVNTANEWVTLTFDFTSQVNSTHTYPKFSLFPDFDTNNQNPVAVESIYYIDDITQQ